jgi:tRNA(Ile)-lysidine synthase
MKNQLENLFYQKISAYSLQKVVVAFSGGADSTALLILFSKFAAAHGIQLQAAHFNHQWRESAKIDQKFCQNLCQQIGVPLTIGFAQDYSCRNFGSAEANARAKRHQFFAQFTDSVIAMAHHMDDQLENFFIKLMRGCSFEGVAKIAELTKVGQLEIFRPLLDFTKTDLVEYLRENKTGYVEDPTNLVNKYLRNKIRNCLLPKLTECDQRAGKNILNFMQKVSDLNDYLTQKVDEQEIINNKELNLVNWQLAEPIIKQEALKKWLFINGYQGDMSTKLLYEISRFLTNSKNNSHQIKSNFVITKSKNIITVKHN